jgi:hypothetical protein
MKELKIRPRMNKPGQGRPYIKRFCSCGAEASLAVQVLVRTVGRGQYGNNRTVKMGGVNLLCERCSRAAVVHESRIAEASLEVTSSVTTRPPDSGLSLFDQAEA